MTIIRISRDLRPAPTFDYYIGPSGSDSNPGTQGSPWAITAINTKQATYVGKRVGLLDGTYDISTFGSGVAEDNRALEVLGGSAGSPTVIQSVNQLGAVLHNGVGASRNAYPAIGENLGNGYIELRGLKIVGGSRAGAMFYYELDNYKPGIVIENCEITDLVHAADVNNADLIWLSACDAPRVSNCKLYECQNINTSNPNGAGIKLYNCRDAVLEYLTVYNCNAGLYPKAEHTSGTQIRYCHIYDCADGIYGLYDMPSDGRTTRIHHCALEHAAAASRGMDFMVSPDFVSSCIQQLFEFYNNTIYVAKEVTGASGGLVALRPSATNVISAWNNIIHRAFTAAISREWGDFGTSVSALVSSRLDRNFYPANSKWTQMGASNPGTPTGSNTTIADWRTYTGAEANSDVGDPIFKFTGSGAERLKLDTGSPCIGTGLTTLAGGGTATDMGCWGNSAPSRIGCDF